jgi:hypothetical protein
MATRSTIAIEFADGTVEQIYAHWDGYLEHNGKILQEHYIDPFKVRELIDHGDVSILGPNIGTKHDFNETNYEVCTFYGRDRGEQGVKARKFKDYADYRTNAQGEEYNYILRQVDGKPVWFVEFYGEFDGPLVNAFAFQEAE